MASDPLPLSTMVHMVTVKLTSSIFLLWHAQISPLLISQKLMPLVDGTTSQPPLTVTSADGDSSPNPDYSSWYERDQLLKLFLISTLSEEAMAIVIGCNSSRDVWLAITTAYSHSSKACELGLKDELLSMKRGTRSVADFGRQFKSLCDQLASIGRPIDELDKAHWFLRGLGSSFSNFTAAQLAQEPLPDFTTLMSCATSHELFQRGLDSSDSQPTALTVSTRGRGGRSSSYRGRGQSSQSRGGSNSRGRGRGRRNWTPRCQFCREEDHDAFDYPHRFDRHYDRNSRSSVANLAEAFSANCNVSGTSTSDWFLDTGASAHMTPDASQLDASNPYAGSDHVVVEPQHRKNHRPRAT